MFAKLLKYDLKYIGRIWWIMAVSMLALSVGGGFCLRDFVFKMNAGETTTAENLTGILEFGALMLLYIAVIAFVIVTGILLFVRYYKNFFTDEGYLTFTLPVSREKLYLSKLVNSLIWNTATFFVILLSVFIILFIVRIPESGESVLVYFVSQILPEITQYINISALWIIVWAIEILLMIFFSTVYSTVLFHLCITVGAIITKKAKVIVAIAIYYGASVVMSTISSIISFAFPLWLSSAGELYPIGLAAHPELLVTMAMLLVCVVMAVFAAALYLINITCLERKLNLA